MTVKLNERAFKHAKRLIEEDKFVDDERESWSDHHSSTQVEEEFIENNGLFEYGKWFLGVNADNSENRKRHYEFPYGDLENVHRCGILAVQSRATQEKYLDVEIAAAYLLALIDKQARKKAQGSR